MWQFVLPFALNQSGSVVYVYLLGSVGTCRQTDEWTNERINKSVLTDRTVVTWRRLSERTE